MTDLAAEDNAAAVAVLVEQPEQFPARAEASLVNWAPAVRPRPVHGRGASPYQGRQSGVGCLQVGKGQQTSRGVLQLRNGAEGRSATNRRGSLLPTIKWAIVGAARGYKVG